MENVTQAITVAVSIIVTCILIGIGIVSVGNIRESYNAQNENIIKLKQEYLEDGLDKYNGVQVTGAEVLNAVKSLKGKYPITVINSGTATMDIDASTDTMKLYTKYKDTGSNEANPMYVNPNGIYYSVLVEINNGNSIQIKFTKKVGSASELGVSDQETVAFLKQRYKAKLDSFLTSIGGEGQTILNSKFETGNTYGYDSFTKAMNALLENMAWETTSTTELSFMNITDDLLSVLSSYIEDEMNSDTALDEAPDTDSDDDDADEEETVDTTSRYLNVLSSLTGSFAFYSENNELVLERYSGIATSLNIGSFYMTSEVTTEDARGSSSNKSLDANWIFSKIATDAFLNNATLSSIKLVSDLIIEDYAFRGSNINTIYLEEGFSLNTFSMYGANAFFGIRTEPTSPVTLYVHENDADTFKNNIDSVGNGVVFTLNKNGNVLGTIDMFGLTGVQVKTYSETVTEVDNFTFTITKAASSTSVAEVSITGYTGSSTDITIPSTLTDSNGVTYKVTSIAEAAFEGSSLTSVVINGNGVINVSQGAFRDSLSLTAVVLNGVPNVRKNAFNGCTSLESVTFSPDSITGTIASTAFYNCKDGMEFNVFSTYLGTVDTAEYNGTTYEITSKAYDILSGYCNNNSNYENYTITILNTTTLQYANLYSTDSPITTNGWQLSGTDDGTAIIKPVDYTALTTNGYFTNGTLTFPRYVEYGANIYTVSQIADSACKGNVDIKTVIIEDGITIIDNSAFNSCSNITTITANSVTTINESAFAGCTNLTGYDFGDSLETIANSAFSSCRALVQISIPYSVKAIGSSAFFGCTSVTNITLGSKTGFSNIESIGKQAFGSCELLQTFTSYYDPASGSLSASNLEDGIFSGSPKDGETLTVQLLYGSNNNSDPFLNYDYDRQGVVFSTAP